LAHRRVNGVDRDKSDAEVLVEILVGGNVAAAALEAHFHVEPSAFANGRDVNVLVEDLDIRIRLDHARRNHTRLIGTQINRLRRVSAQLERNLLQVQDDISRVFNHAGNRLEFVQNAFNLDGGNCRTFDRAEQHATKRVTNGRSETALKRLRPEHS